MCGIGGILRVHAAGTAPAPELAIPEAWLDLLDASVRHRGPDGQGRFRHRVVRADGAIVDVALVHRRLSVIDHAGGGQPMVIGGLPGDLLGGPTGGPTLHGGSGGTQGESGHPLLFGPAPPDAPGPAGPEGYAAARAHQCPRCAESPPGTVGVPSGADGAVAVVFNGCIYNHRALRQELEAAGHTFASDHADTEVLAHGWRQWGEELFPRLEGMFALTIWDGASGRLSVARDPFGEKPLYAAGCDAPGSCRAFSSAASGLIRLRKLIGAAAAPGAEGSDALRGWIKFGWSQNEILPGLGATFPGTCRELAGDSRGADIEKASNANGGRDWWFASLRPGRTAPTVDEVDGALRSAVHSRLEADVDIGCFLSGGIDSSLIAKYTCEARPEITAFTVRMQDASLDESEAAQRVARHLGMRHEILDCAAQPSEDLISIIEQLGVPFGDSSLLPTLWVSRAARGAVAVALAGDGGDELFLGYDRHRAINALKTLSLLPRPLRRALAALLPPASQRKSSITRLSRLLNAAAQTGYKELVAIFDPPHDSHLFATGDLQRGQPAIYHPGTTLGGREATEMLALRFDRLFYLPEDLLRKTDTASMAVALEVRAPFLASPVARIAFGAATRHLMPGGQRKGLLRAVARRHLPAEIIDRPKQGFAIPIGDWFRSDYGRMRQLLRDHMDSAEPFGPDDLGINAMIDMGYVRRMLREHDDAGAGSLWPWKGRDHGQRLYMLLVLSIWARWISRQ